jgi:pentatricopeptide repeat protein
MHLRDMKPSYKTWHALVHGSARAAKSDVALKLYVDMRSEGHLPRSKSGSALIVALSAAQQLEAALLVLRDMHNCASGYRGPPAELTALVRPERQLEERPRQLHDILSRPPSTGPMESSSRLLQITQCLAPLQFFDEEAPTSDALALRHSSRVHARRNQSHATRGLRRTRHHTAGSRSPLQKGDMLPRASAVGKLVLALTLGGHLSSAMLLYSRLRDHGKGTLIELAVRLTRMFETLMEVNCRNKDIHAALGVFDDWKAARDAVIQQQGWPRHRQVQEEEQGVLEPPPLASVTLAFLEACCHAYSDGDELKWRVYDVCAVMRQQQEARRHDELPRPVKGSHHVREYDEGREEKDAW